MHVDTVLYFFYFFYFTSMEHFYYGYLLVCVSTNYIWRTLYEMFYMITLLLKQWPKLWDGLIQSFLGLLRNPLGWDGMDSFNSTETVFL